MNSIAVIPARGGSKRIPRKNVKNFLGKPIIGYAIQNAIDSNLFSEVYVSTDDEEIKDISESFGARCDWLRSDRLSDDFATTSDVIYDTICKLSENHFEYLCCIYPATPLLKINHIRSGFDLIVSNEWDFVFAATPVHENYFRSFIEQESKGLRMLFPEFEKERTQDLPIGYVDAGQFYWGKREAWESAKPIFSQHSTIVKGKANEFVDIDTIDDWERAESMFKERAANTNE